MNTRPAGTRKNELEFHKKVKNAYEFAGAVIAAGATIGGVFFPPTAFIGAGLLLLLAILRYYDKKNDYKLSKALAKIYSKLTGDHAITQTDSVTRRVLASLPVSNNENPAAIPVPQAQLPSSALQANSIFANQASTGNLKTGVSESPGIQLQFK